jgi:hypothetical protein
VHVAILCSSFGMGQGHVSARIQVSGSEDDTRIAKDGGMRGQDRKLEGILPRYIFFLVDLSLT